MRIHTYAAGASGAVTHPDVAPEVVLRELIIIETDEFVYRVGDEVEIDVELTVLELFGEAPGHVIAHRCRTVSVTVGYAGEDKDITVHPAAHVKRVRAKAIEAFQLDRASAADLVLRLPGATTDLPMSHPIGAYVPKGTCAVTVDLIHAVRPQG